MLRFRIAAALVLSLAAPAAWNACESAYPEVFRQAVSTLRSHGHSSALVDSSTAPGAEQFAREWVTKRRGSVIAEELAAAYEAHSEPAELPAGVTGGLKTADLRDYVTGAGYDWERLTKDFPGTTLVIRASAPACDRLDSIALVRLDYITAEREGGANRSWTVFHDVERQPDDSWKVSLMAHGGMEMMHGNDFTVTPPARK
jgi:hypothetical protein